MSIRSRFRILIKEIINQPKGLAKLAYLSTMASLMLSAVAPTVQASDALSAQEIRQLSQQGKIKPLLQILQQHQFDGTLLDVELEREKGRLIYELEFLNDQDEVWEYELDAETGRLLSTELEEHKKITPKRMPKVNEKDTDEVIDR
ncbi:Uncharacterized membrane protein YkoI [Oceanospirillum multiglobuliferum]|nr:Uncharacterized membrane protein YkoI [Oceanospirillum multiglobuliferum]